MANYGLGGQYSQHLDPHGHWEGRVNQLTPFTGDRLMTVMVYLSQVGDGGGQEVTVEPRWRLVGPPPSH